MKKDTANFLTILDSRLSERFGVPTTKPEADPTGALVRGILSANTNDINRDRAFDRIIKTYPEEASRWQTVLDIETKKLAELIKPAGMSLIRAERIQGLLSWLLDEFGAITAQPFLEMPVDEAFARLKNIKGIGAKTAAVFLVFNKEHSSVKYFPVDTHIHRVAGRIGIFPVKTNPSKMIELFSEIVPKEINISLHINMIELGRHICKARKVFCDECPINSICDKLNLPLN